MKTLIPVVALASVVAACSGGGPTDPEGEARPLAARSRMEGSAAVTAADGTSVSCLLDLVFELAPHGQRFPSVIRYEGTHGGSIQRTLFYASGHGISLWPDVAGEVVGESVAPNQVRLAIPLNATSESRFYRALSEFRGSIGVDGVVTGSWDCAPFDITSGGYTDTQYTAHGTWTLVPIP